jgi:hypothetical protein
MVGENGRNVGKPAIGVARGNGGRLERRTRLDI